MADLYTWVGQPPVSVIGPVPGIAPLSMSQNEVTVRIGETRIIGITPLFVSVTEIARISEFYGGSGGGITWASTSILFSNAGVTFSTL